MMQTLLPIAGALMSGFLSNNSSAPSLPRGVMKDQKQLYRLLLNYARGIPGSGMDAMVLSQAQGALDQQFGQNRDALLAAMRPADGANQADLLTGLQSQHDGARAALYGSLFPAFMANRQNAMGQAGQLGGSILSAQLGAYNAQNAAAQGGGGGGIGDVMGALAQHMAYQRELDGGAKPLDRREAPGTDYDPLIPRFGGGLRRQTTDLSDPRRNPFGDLYF